MVSAAVTLGRNRLNPLLLILATLLNLDIFTHIETLGNDDVCGLVYGLVIHRDLIIYGVALDAATDILVKMLRVVANKLVDTAVILLGLVAIIVL